MAPQSPPAFWLSNKPDLTRRSAFNAHSECPVLSCRIRATTIGLAPLVLLSHGGSLSRGLVPGPFHWVDLPQAPGARASKARSESDGPGPLPPWAWCRAQPGGRAQLGSPSRVGLPAQLERPRRLAMDAGGGATKLRPRYRTARSLRLPRLAY
jgi:hypothetical protein